MGLFSGGLIIGRIFASEAWEVYFREGLFFFGGGGGGEGSGAYYRNFAVLEKVVALERWSPWRGGRL